jgi:Xaa-Pro aminopeptidase
MNREFFTKNRAKLQSQLADRSITVLFAGRAPKKSADETYEFTPNRNFYYLTGIEKPHAILMMVKWGEKVEETLFIERPDPVKEKWDGKMMREDEARAIAGVEKVLFADQFLEQFLRLLMDDYKHLYLDLERDAWELPITHEQAFAREVREKYPFLNVENVYHKIAHLRRIKSAEEVAMIKRAIEITDKGIRHLLANAKPGMKEYQLEAYFDFILRSNGVRDRAFRTIMASGANATVLHYESNDSVVGDNDLVLLDLGAVYGHYSADISRTFPISGKFTDRQKELYNIVLKAEETVINAIKPGLPFAELNVICKKVLSEELLRIGLIEREEELSKYYYHGVSHYLGLDTHDVGSYRDAVLEPGMVLTVEPGLYIAEEGIGIRIEDDVLVTEDGHEVLSKQILKTVEEIEAFMAQHR